MLKATFRPTRASQYLRPGGPWDVPSLDAVLAARTPGVLAEQIAAIGGCKVRTARRWLAGTFPPSAKIVLAIAQSLIE